MTSRTVTVIGFGIIMLAAACIDALARNGDRDVENLGDFVGELTRYRAGRVVLMIVWAAAGLHFLAY